MPREFIHWKSYQPRLNTIRIEGTVTLASDASISAQDVPATTVTKTGTGEYTFTFDKKYRQRYNCQVSFESDTDVDITTQIDSVDVVTAKTVVVKTMAGAVPTDVSAIGKINFYIAVKR